MNRRVPRSRRFVAILLLALLAGCHSWQLATVSPESVVSEARPVSVRLTRADGEIVRIDNPIVRNDSIVSVERSQAGVVGVPTRDINSLEVRRFHAGKTIGFVVATVGIALGWARVAAGSSGGTDSGPGPLLKSPH